MDENQLLTMWRQGLRIAERRCARTLARLERGEGGMYEADDLRQDLFLEFWRLVESWSSQGAGDEGALWAAWRRCLWNAGSAILRRPPQRLWHLVSESLNNEYWVGEPELSGPRNLSPLRTIERALTQPEDAEAALMREESQADLAQALPKLRTERRSGRLPARTSHQGPGAVESGR